VKKNWGYTKCATSPYWADEPLGANVMKVGIYHDVRTAVIDSKFGVDRSRVFSRRTFENRPFPLKASIAYTTLPCANALACETVAYINAGGKIRIEIYYWNGPMIHVLTSNVSVP
jgi:hypothetical protein